MFSPSSAPPSRILFFRQGNFSHINARVAGWLREQFPSLELVEIDVLQEIIKPARTVMVAGAGATLVTYPRRVRNGDFRDLYYKTPYMFRAVRRLVAEQYGELARTAVFSLQTQSLYDAGVTGLPHFIYTDHTHLANRRYPSSQDYQLADPRWIDMERDLYHSVTGNLVMSEFVKRSLIEDYGCEPASVDVVGAAPNLPPPTGLLDNDRYGNKVILFVGIDWERKGGPVLVRAFERVLERVPDARLVIAGCSPEVALPNVEIVGRCPLPEVSRLLLRSSILALPSWREPQGINAIEAMAHGIPVVTTHVGALPEAVLDGRCGRVVAPGDHVALAAALVDLLMDPEMCRRYGEAGRKHAQEQYSSQVVSRKMGDAIRKRIALAQPSAPPAAA